MLLLLTVLYTYIYIYYVTFLWLNGFALVWFLQAERKRKRESSKNSAGFAFESTHLCKTAKKA